MSYILKTNQAAYLLDPDNEDLVLKKKVSSVQYIWVTGLKTNFQW